MSLSVKKNTEQVTELLTLLRRHGVAPTQQRLLIAQVLLAKPQHLSAEQVLTAVNCDADEVSKATVYNTLKLFAANGLIREVIVDPARVFYDSTTQPHYHIFNSDTGELTDIAADAVTVSGLPPLPRGTVAAGVDVVLRVRNG